MVLDRIRALPCWQGNITAEPLPGGLSNEIWKVTDALGSHVVRFGVYYPFHHVNRAREAMASRAAHACGFAPAVEYVAMGVMVTAFIEARTWGPTDMARGHGGLCRTSTTLSARDNHLGRFSGR
jgi:thiamine kinase-like enzyme